MPRRDSDSESDRTSHRKKSSKRSRRSSSSDSHGDSDSSSAKKHRHHGSRYNSQSRSPSRESRRKEWKHSRSPKRRSRRSRSSSVSRHASRSRSRSSSRSRSRRTRRSRSRSGSHSRSFKSKSSKRHRRSASRSRSKSPRQKSSSTKVLVPPQPEVCFLKTNESDKLKRKVQQALKAAASADAELREKGLLGGEAPSTTPDFLGLGSSTATITDQLRRVQTLEEINAPSFTQQQFLSSRSSTKTTQKTEDVLDKDAHSAAIFGLGAPKLGVTSLSSDASIKKLETWKENPMMLVHHSLFGDEEGKQERWVKKLLAMRRKLVSGEMF